MPSIVTAAVLALVVLAVPLAAWLVRRSAVQTRTATPAERALEEALARAAESGRNVQVTAAGGLFEAPGVGGRGAEAFAAAQVARRIRDVAGRRGVALRAAAGDVISAELLARAADMSSSESLLVHGSDLAYATAVNAAAADQQPAAFVHVGSIGSVYPLVATAYTRVPQIGAAADGATLAQIELSGAQVLSAEQMYLYDPAQRSPRAVQARLLVHDILRVLTLSAIVVAVVIGIGAQLGWWPPLQWEG